ncbi:MAG: hypothetical protein KAH54_05115 [Candidatus Sabulitectum sp.]|nr:hypothetical protein [Candidatus Sabulitectum sp.]
MAWYYIKGRWWIFVIATVPFFVLGVVFIWLHFDASWHREWYNSLLFLGILFIISPILQLWWTLRKIHRGQKNESELIARSTIGCATVISLEETGLYTNDIPEVEILLEVHSKDDTTYRLTHREHVNLSDLPGLAPGSEIAIRVDSLNRKNVFLHFP